MIALFLGRGVDRARARAAEHHMLCRLERRNDIVERRRIAHQFVMRNLPPHIAVRSGRQFAQPRSDARIPRRHDAPHRLEIACDAVLRRRDGELGDMVDALETVIRHQCEIITCRQRVEQLPDQVVGPLQDRIGIAAERAAVVGFGIQVDEMDQQQIGCPRTQKIERGQRARAVVHPLLGK